MINVKEREPIVYAPELIEKADAQTKLKFLLLVDEDKWEEVKLKELRAGDIFKPVTDVSGYAEEYEATTDAYIDMFDSKWTIESIPLKRNAELLAHTTGEVTE